MNSRYLFFISFFLLLLTSCQPHKKPLLSGEPNIADSLQPPAVINISQVEPQPYRAPEVIEIPKSKYSRDLKDKTVEMLLPETKPADFFVTMKKYSTEQGLALSSVTSEFIDRAGNIWFGTEGGGVSRYDGKSFTNYTTAQGLGNNIVRCITGDRDGNIWFGTFGGGVSRYDGRSFINYTQTNGLVSNYVWKMMTDKTGNIWFGTQEGVSKFDGKKFTNYTIADGLPYNIVKGIYQDKNGNIWLGTDGGGVSCYNGKSFNNFTAKDGLNINTVRCIIQDKKGTFWFGGNGLSCYDGTTFTPVTNIPGSKNGVNDIIEDRSGNLWFGFDGAGAIVYDPTSTDTSPKTFNHFTSARGLTNNFVSAIAEDLSGNIWFGLASGGGVCRYDGASFISFSTSQGLPVNIIWSIREDKTGDLWLGTDNGGVCRYDNKTLPGGKPGFTTYSRLQGLAGKVIVSILQDKKGTLWFGTDGEGVSHYDGKSFTNYSTAQGLPDKTIWSINEDRNGKIWFGTDAGVSCFDGKNFTNYTTVQGLTNNVVSCCTEDKMGNLWFGTQGGGISVFNEKTFTNYTTAQGLASNMVTCILEDRNGNMWIGTAGKGTSILREKEKKQLSDFTGNSGNKKMPAVFENYSTKEGLADDMVYDMVEDHRGSIIIGTNAGITLLKNGHDSMPSMGEQEYYNTKSGYPIKDLNTKAMFCDSKNIIWIGSTNLVRFDHSCIHKNLNSPVVTIQNIKVNEENICWYDVLKNRMDKQKRNTGKGEKDSINNSLYGIKDLDGAILNEEVSVFGRTLSTEQRNTMLEKFKDVRFDSIRKNYSIPENLTLPYIHNNITIDYAAIETARPFLVKYQYILEGYENEWSPVTDKTSASFGNIHEGSYTFFVKARSPDGVWSRPVSYTFTVLPPWYRTWYMYALYIIAFILSIWIFIKWRERNLQLEKKTLEEKVETRTQQLQEEKKEVEKQKALTEKQHELAVSRRIIAEEQKEVIAQQKILVEEKQKEIIDSINYARRIQQALLKNEEHVTIHLPSHFILFKPKDIVSGDFYWGFEKQGHWYIAAADCTGHGVPGAFMSMLGISFLNEINATKELLTPAEILDLLKEKVMKELGQSGASDESKDGMDISLARINYQTKEVQWAGANNSLYTVSNGLLNEIKADKQPIGYFPVTKPFTNHTLNLKKGEIFYLFTDGFADQFGGPSGKKFKYKQLEDLVISIHNLSVKEQKTELNNIFEAWRGNLEQVDDICIIGVRL